MRVLVNATTCVVGGGAQVAANFISRACRDDRHVFYFAVSSQVRKHLSQTTVDVPLFESVYLPSRPWAWRRTRYALRRAELLFRPDIVFTVFGPAYHRFSVPHVCGIANAWLTHPSDISLELLSPLARFRRRVLSRYKISWLSRNDFFWTETEVSQRSLARIAHVRQDRIKVIANCYSDVFADQKFQPPAFKSYPLRVFTIGTPYLHKRFPFITEVVAELKRQGWGDGVVFVVTLPADGKEVARFWERAHALDVVSMIENIGPITLDLCPKQYAMADCVFLPTVLETFSVSYLEAMKTKRPIITSDLDFARELCGDAAEYFDPHSAQSAAAAIQRVVSVPARVQELTANGTRRLASFPSPDEKYEEHVNWLKMALISS